APHAILLGGGERIFPADRQRPPAAARQLRDRRHESRSAHSEQLEATERSFRSRGRSGRSTPPTSRASPIPLSFGERARASPPCPSRSPPGPSTAALGQPRR